VIELGREGKIDTTGLGVIVRGWGEENRLSLRPDAPPQREQSAECFTLYSVGGGSEKEFPYDPRAEIQRAHTSRDGFSLRILRN